MPKRVLGKNLGQPSAQENGHVHVVHYFGGAWAAVGCFYTPTSLRNSSAIPSASLFGMYAEAGRIIQLTPDFRVHRATLGGEARARLPNLSDINRKAALTRW